MQLHIGIAILVVSFLLPFVLWYLGLKKEKDGIVNLVIGSVCFSLFWLGALSGILNLPRRTGFLVFFLFAAGLIYLSYFLCSEKGLFWRKTIKLNSLRRFKSKTYTTVLERIISESKDACLPNIKLMNAFYKSTNINFPKYISLLDAFPTSDYSDAYELRARWTTFHLARSFVTHVDTHLVIGGLSSEGQQCLHICAITLQWLREHGHISDSEYDEACLSLHDASLSSTIDYFYP